MKEDSPDGTLMPIGRFSRMTRLSIKALRLYDELGLLRPKWVDDSSGYRYYGPEQADRAEAIRALRAVDMPLEEVHRVLNLAPEASAKVLEDHQRRLTIRLAEDSRRLSFLKELIEGRRHLVPYEIEIKELPDQEVASLTAHVSLATVGDAVTNGFGRLVQAMQAQGATPAAAPFTVYHDVIDEETEGDIEMCIPVTGPFEDEGKVISKTIAGGPAAVTTHKGRYDELGPAYHALSTWIAGHGHQMAGPPRETYLNDPNQVSADELLTEVAWPIDSGDLS